MEPTVIRKVDFRIGGNAASSHEDIINEMESLVSEFTNKTRARPILIQVSTELVRAFSCKQNIDDSFLSEKIVDIPNVFNVSSDSALSKYTVRLSHIDLWGDISPVSSAPIGLVSTFVGEDGEGYKGCGTGEDTVCTTVTGRTPSDDIKAALAYNLFGTTPYGDFVTQERTPSDDTPTVLACTPFGLIPSEDRVTRARTPSKEEMEAMPVMPAVTINNNTDAVVTANFTENGDIMVNTTDKTDEE